jgi:hypothetical protein
VASEYAGGDGQTAGTIPAGGRKGRRRAMVGGMEWSLRKESLSIVAAAGPSTAAESAGAAADNTDQDNRAAGLNSLRRWRRHHHHTDSRRTASKMKKGMGSEGGGKGRAKRRDGEKKRVGLKTG